VRSGRGQDVDNETRFGGCPRPAGGRPAGSRGAGQDEQHPATQAVIPSPESPDRSRARATLGSRVPSWSRTPSWYAIPHQCPARGRSGHACTSLPCPRISTCRISPAGGMASAGTVIAGPREPQTTWGGPGPGWQGRAGQCRWRAPLRHRARQVEHRLAGGHRAARQQCAPGQHGRRQPFRRNRSARNRSAQRAAGVVQVS
jgi:hypothetical protein